MKRSKGPILPAGLLYMTQIQLKTSTRRSTEMFRPFPQNIQCQMNSLADGVGLPEPHSAVESLTERGRPFPSANENHSLFTPKITSKLKCREKDLSGAPLMTEYTCVHPFLSF